MPRRGWGVLAVTGVVVLAGCSGFGAGVDRERTPDRTTYGVPDRATPTTTVEFVGFAPVGTLAEPRCSVASPQSNELTPLRESYLGSATQVVTGHRRELTGCSYRVTMNRTARAANGTVVRATRVRAAFDEDYQPYVVRRTHLRPGSEPLSILVWSDGRRVHQVQVVNGTGYDGRGSHLAGPDTEDSPPSPRAALDDPTFGSLVRRAFAATDPVQTEDAPRPGEPPRYLVVSESANPAALAPPGYENVSNVSMRAVLDNWGVVRHLVVTYDATTDGRAVHVRTVLRIDDVGNTTVEIPREPGPG